MYKSAVITCLIGMSFFAGVLGEDVYSTNCSRTTKESSPLCEVHKFAVSPCALAPDGPCEVPRGQNVTIEIEFTSKTKISKKAKHGYYWESTIDIPFKGINTNACGTFMACPVKKNNRVVYSGILPTKRNFPAGTYPVKVKIYQGTNKIIFCRVVRIKLV